MKNLDERIALAKQLMEKKAELDAQLAQLLSGEAPPKRKYSKRNGADEALTSESGMDLDLRIEPSFS